MFTRTRYQNGSLTVKKRGSGHSVWEFRYYEPNASGRRTRRTITLGPLSEYPTQSAARKSPALQALLLNINADRPTSMPVPLFGAVLARYEEEEMPIRYSTRCSYQSYIGHYIRPRWADTLVTDIKPISVENWLKKLDLAPKTRSHIRGLMHTICECARRWELLQRNPIELVRVKGGTKRITPPTVLSIEQFHAVLRHLRQPYRTMALVGGCLGLRVSEIVGLQWSDFDLEEGTLLVQRSVVHGRVDEVKTECSRDFVPIDGSLASSLRQYRAECYPTVEGWLFANPETGKPYHQDSIQQDHIRPAGRAAGVSNHLGWHAFRHSYRAWLETVGAPLGVQKELMRHASIQTTMNIYGKTMTDTKRQVNSRVVRMILPVQEDASSIMDGSVVAKAG